jgi:type IV pilus assembly protein PilC
MANYRYLAYDTGGRRVSQTVSANSPDEVKQWLWQEGLYIIDIRQPRFRLPSLPEAMPSLFGVRRSEVILLTKQLATFVHVGMPIMEGLNVLREQAGSPPMRVALAQMMRDLDTGASLSEAMAKHSQIFTRLYIEMVRSAELSGNLDDVLRQLAGYMSRDEGSLRKVRNAMIYPGIVIGLALAVISVLIGFVLPAFARLFSDFRASMPLPTRILLTVGLFSRDHLVQIFLTMALLVIGSIVYSRTGRGKAVIDVVLLRLPMLGTIIRYSIIERYLRTLATLARAGVPVAQMLDTANRSLGNTVFQSGLAAVRSQMLSGDGFARPLDRTGLFPRIVIQMIKVGEETGSLDANLQEAADHYAEEVDYRLKQMITLMEPALVIVVGAMVGFIAISVIAPMYSLVHAIH